MKQMRHACRILAWKPQQNLKRALAKHVWLVPTDDLEDLAIDGRIILKRILKKWLAISAAGWAPVVVSCDHGTLLRVQ
jgi:hypothetical protein